MKKKGYDVTTASSGKSAISKIENNTFHLVLLDIRMPEMDGIETLRKIREINKNVGVIVVTGLKDESLSSSLSELGVNDYVIKPFDFDYLDKTIALQLFSTSNV